MARAPASNIDVGAIDSRGESIGEAYFFFPASASFASRRTFEPSDISW
jgi:hypothetical protein